MDSLDVYVKKREERRRRLKTPVKRAAAFAAKLAGGQQQQQETSAAKVRVQETRLLADFENGHPVGVLVTSACNCSRYIAVRICHHQAT